MVENILRVEAGRIDNVLNLVGELIIGKSMLQQALGEFGSAASVPGLTRALNDVNRDVRRAAAEALGRKRDQ